MFEWIDQYPWWQVVLVGFGIGALVGVVLRVARRGKYLSKEAGGAP